MTTRTPDARDVLERLDALVALRTAAKHYAGTSAQGDVSIIFDAIRMCCEYALSLPTMDAATLPEPGAAGKGVGKDGRVTMTMAKVWESNAYERGRRDEREACIAEVEAHLNFAQNAGDFDGKESELRTTSYLLNRIRQRSRNGGENE